MEMNMTDSMHLDINFFIFYPTTTIFHALKMQISFQIKKLIDPFLIRKID